jgi:hypothetical protein
MPIDLTEFFETLPNAKKLMNNEGFEITIKDIRDALSLCSPDKGLGPSTLTVRPLRD